MTDIFNFDFNTITNGLTEEVNTGVTDIKKVQEGLDTSGTAVATQQSQVLAAMKAQGAAASTTIDQNAELQNLILDETVKNDAILSSQYKELDALADPVQQARDVSAAHTRLEEATKQYNADELESQKLTPSGFVAHFRKGISEAAMKGAARDLKLEISGFQDIQDIRTTVLSNYQTRTTLMSEERAALEKELNLSKAAQTKLTNNTALEVRDLEFTMERYNISKDKQASVIAGLNAKLQGRQIQLATVQAEVQAAMMPYQLEQMQITTANMKDDRAQRKNFEAQFGMLYPDKVLPPNWTDPRVQSTMDISTIAAMQRVQSGMEFGQGEASYSAALQAAQAGNNVQAQEYIAMTDEVITAANSAARAAAIAANPLAATTHKDPFDRKDPMYAAKVDVYMRQFARNAELVDATDVTNNGYATLESSKALIANGEMPLEAWVTQGIITDATKTLLETGNVDLIVARGDGNTQVTTSLTQLFEAREAAKSKGENISNADLAKAYVSWSAFALQRSNASPNTPMNLTTLTYPGVDSFSSQSGMFQRFATERKSLDITDINQVMARFDSMSKRRAKRADSAAATVKGDFSGYKGITSPTATMQQGTPYRWLNIGK